jgi:hypothetical protein
MSPLCPLCHMTPNDAPTGGVVLPHGEVPAGRTCAQCAAGDGSLEAIKTGSHLVWLHRECRPFWESHQLEVSTSRRRARISGSRACATCGLDDGKTNKASVDGVDLWIHSGECVRRFIQEDTTPTTWTWSRWVGDCAVLPIYRPPVSAVATAVDRLRRIPGDLLRIDGELVMVADREPPPEIIAAICAWPAVSNSFARHQAA